MNIALSGASGFIGGHLKTFLDQLNDVNVICLSRSTADQDCRNKIIFSYDDFCSGNLDIEIDYFIHLASPNYDYCNDDSITKGVVDLTSSILRSLNKYKCKKFIFFSTAKVYGESSTKINFFNEISNLNPISDYAKAKALAEKNVQKISIEEDISYLIYRLPFVYGKDMNSNIGKLLKVLDRSLPIPSFKDEINLKKSFLSVENIKKIIEFNIYNNESINNEVINISDLYPESFNFFLQSYKNLTKSNSLLIKLPKFIFYTLIRIPIIGSLFVKMYGDLKIDNKKLIKMMKGKKILTTLEGISYLVEE